MELQWYVEFTVNADVFQKFRDYYPKLNYGTSDCPGCVYFYGEVHSEQELINLILLIKENVLDVVNFSFDFDHSFI
jgi:hypothetical protein